MFWSEKRKDRASGFVPKKTSCWDLEDSVSDGASGAASKAHRPLDITHTCGQTPGPHQQLNGESLFACRQGDITRLLFLSLAVFGYKHKWHARTHKRVHTMPTFAGLSGLATNPEWQLLLQIHHILHLFNLSLPLVFACAWLLFLFHRDCLQVFFSLLLKFLNPPLLTQDLFPPLCLSMSWTEVQDTGPATKNRNRQEVWLYIPQLKLTEDAGNFQMTWQRPAAACGAGGGDVVMTCWVSGFCCTSVSCFSTDIECPVEKVESQGCHPDWSRDLTSHPHTGKGSYFQSIWEYILSAKPTNVSINKNCTLTNNVFCNFCKQHKWTQM